MKKKEKICFLGLLLMNPILIMSGIFIGLEVGNDTDMSWFVISGGAMIVCALILLTDKEGS